MRAALLALPLGLLFLLPACPGEPASPTVTVPDGGGSSVEAVEASALPIIPSDAPPGCGCSLCAPVVSADPCTKFEDCAPDAVCHAKGCVAKAKAPVPPPNLSCTQDFQCNAIEANACGCFEGKCALMPRQKK